MCTAHIYCVNYKETLTLSFLDNEINIFVCHGPTKNILTGFYCPLLLCVPWSRGLNYCCDLTAIEKQFLNKPAISMYALYVLYFC